MLIVVQQRTQITTTTININNHNHAHIVTGATTPSSTHNHHHNNENKQDDDVISTVSASSVGKSSHVMTLSSMARVDALLDELVDVIHVQLHQEKLLDHCIQEQVQIAHDMLRHVQEGNGSNRNQIGFIVQMHKIHQMQITRERINLVIQLLQDHVESIESQLKEQLERHNYDDLDKDVIMMMMMKDDRNETNKMILCIDTTNQRNYVEQVHAILSTPLQESIL